MKNIDLYGKNQVWLDNETRNQGSNDKAERMHHTIMNMARCMIFSGCLQFLFWGDAAQYETYILNGSFKNASADEISLLQLLATKAPTVGEIFEFWLSVHGLAQRGQRGFIIGIRDSTKGYLVSLQKDRIVVTTQHVKNLLSLSAEQNEQIQQSIVQVKKMLQKMMREQEKKKKILIRIGISRWQAHRMGIMGWTLKKSLAKRR